MQTSSYTATQAELSYVLHHARSVGMAGWTYRYRSEPQDGPDLFHVTGCRRRINRILHELAIYLGQPNHGSPHANTTTETSFKVVS